MQVQSWYCPPVFLVLFQRIERASLLAFCNGFIFLGKDYYDAWLSFLYTCRLIITYHGLFLVLFILFKLGNGK